MPASFPCISLAMSKLFMHSNSHVAIVTTSFPHSLDRRPCYGHCPLHHLAMISPRFIPSKIPIRFPTPRQLELETTSLKKPDVISSLKKTL